MKTTATHEIATAAIAKAAENVDKAEMKSSAVLCIDDARSLLEKGDYENAIARARGSLEYSIGRSAAATYIANCYPSPTHHDCGREFVPKGATSCWYCHS